MKNLLCLVSVAIVCSAATYAQEATLSAPRSDDSFVPLPDGWRQTDNESGYPTYETPQQRVLRNAALKAAQRRERMAINARFGYSPSRPPASTVPSMGSPIGPPTSYRIYTPYPGFAFPRGYIRF